MSFMESLGALLTLFWVPRAMNAGQIQPLIASDTTDVSCDEGDDFDIEALRDREREFLSGLKATTGRDLSEWVSTIAASGLAHRNEKIDQLRYMGLSFRDASWLERIHHNGGSPIYVSSLICEPKTKIPRKIESVERFIHATRQTRPGVSMTSKSLFRAYRAFCDAQSLPVVSLRSLQNQVQLFPDAIERGRKPPKVRGNKQHRPTFYIMKPLPAARSQSCADRRLAA